MAIVVKVAKTEKELNDVYQLRFQVYTEEGYYPQVKATFIKDKFDDSEHVVNIIAYDGDTPVGTMRANLDNECMLPADHVVDFNEYRNSVVKKAQNADLPIPVFGGSSMLAIAREWRSNPIIYREMIHLSLKAGEKWQVTHLISVINAKLASLHKRIGWEQLTEKYWFEDANEYIVPMGTELKNIRQWYNKSVS